MLISAGISRISSYGTDRSAPISASPVAAFLILFDQKLLGFETREPASDDMLSAAISAGLVVRDCNGGWCLTPWGQTVASILNIDEPMRLGRHP
jgi:hypothetical protein